MTIRALRAVTMAAAVCLTQEAGASGQKKLAFDVVSVKPVTPGRGERSESYCAAGGRFISHGTPLLWSIKWAYALTDYQVRDGWPLWLNAFGTYDIQAKADNVVTDADCRSMLQALFEDRFKLRMHRERKTVRAYQLVVTKSGPNFSNGTSVTINGVVKQSTSEREAPRGWTMARLANYLSTVRTVQRPVIDRTMLGGLYGFSLMHATGELDERPDIFTALPEQLGLRLESTQAPIEMWTIDHVERPVTD